MQLHPRRVWRAKGRSQGLPEEATEHQIGDLNDFSP